MPKAIARARITSTWWTRSRSSSTLGAFPESGAGGADRGVSFPDQGLSCRQRFRIRQPSRHGAAEQAARREVHQVQRLFPTEQRDDKGRIRKRYRDADVMTPCEKLKLLDNAERCPSLAHTREPLAHELQGTNNKELSMKNKAIAQDLYARHLCSKIETLPIPIRFGQFDRHLPARSDQTIQPGCNSSIHGSPQPFPTPRRRAPAARPACRGLHSGAANTSGNRRCPPRRRRSYLQCPS